MRYVLGQGNRILARAPVTILGVTAYVEAAETSGAGRGGGSQMDGAGIPRGLHIHRPAGRAGKYLQGLLLYEKGQPAQAAGALGPGSYEVRYVLGQGNKVLAHTPVTVVAVTAQVEPPSSVNAAAVFDVKWSGPDNPGDQYISISQPGTAGNVYKNYAYTRTGNPLKLTAPSDPGQYEVRYVLGQGDKILAQSPITVQSVGASVRPPASTPAGGEFRVEWQGPFAQGDYISVASPGSAPNQYVTYAYTEKGNPAGLVAPPDPGQYEVRYILDQDTKLLAKAPISVTPVNASVSAPAEVANEAEFQVRWEGPGYSGDYVTIVAPGAPADASDSYFYTNDNPGSLKAPSQPGDYEVRYIMDNGKKVLGKTKITVR